MLNEATLESDRPSSASSSSQMDISSIPSSVYLQQQEPQQQE